MASYENPTPCYNSSSELFVHHRPLGKKIHGYYPNVSWSEIALQNVPVETTIQSSIENEYLRQQLRKSQYPYIDIIQDASDIIQDKEICIQESIKKKNHICKGDKPSHIKMMKQTSDHIRTRPVPKHTKKNYTTKPKDYGKIHRNKYGKQLHVL